MENIIINFKTELYMKIRNLLVRGVKFILNGLGFLIQLPSAIVAFLAVAVFVIARYISIIPNTLSAWLVYLGEWKWGSYLWRIQYEARLVHHEVMRTFFKRK